MNQREKAKRYDESMVVMMDIIANTEDRRTIKKIEDFIFDRDPTEVIL